MFAQMKRKKPEVSETKPSKKYKLIPYPLIFPILMPIMFPIGLAYLIAYLLPPSIRHIEVDGKDCVVEYVVDRRNSHGGVVGHDKAVCP
jgi:hypothetical protein